jgi:DNA mismatch repair protein MutL
MTIAIKRLSEETINRIAAGEVVERPLSVVRELVDNSLDAKATSITVELRDGGQTLIRVSDDGTGIRSSEIELAFERHATSKIEKEEDLISIQSFGFRGEALASISSVSKLRVRTRHVTEEAGVEVEFEGGVLVGRQRVAMPVGTEILVQELFFNTPARKKFLKTDRGETIKITAWLRGNALLHPDVRTKLIVDGKEKLQLAHRSSSLERAREIYPGEAVPVSYEEQQLRVTGYLCAPHYAKATPSALTFFVNGRMLSDRALLRAVREGFGGTLKPQQAPLGYLHIELPGDLVDVNVHPQKQEVRFWNSSRIFQLVLRSVRSAVGAFKSPLVGAVSRERETLGKVHAPSSSAPAVVPGFRIEEQKLDFQPSQSFPTAIATDQIDDGRRQQGLDSGSDSSAIESLRERGANSTSATASVVKGATDGFRYQDLRYLGTVLSCYLICEYGEQLVVIDMHAAHERINYNEILDRLRSRIPQKEALLIPLTLQFDIELVERIVEQEAFFTHCGFQIQVRGETAIDVLEKPTWIALKQVKAALRELAEEDLPVERALESELEKVAARLACHASIRSGDIQTREEVFALFAALDEAEWSSACPHGRPVITTFGKHELERRFGRV